MMALEEVVLEILILFPQLPITEYLLLEVSEDQTITILKPQLIHLQEMMDSETVEDLEVEVPLVVELPGVLVAEVLEEDLDKKNKIINHLFNRNDQ